MENWFQEFLMQICFILTMRNVNYQVSKGEEFIVSFYINYEECK